MSALTQKKSDSWQVLAKALFKAQEQLALTQAELGQAIGLDRSSVSRLKGRGELDPGSKTGDLAAILVRIYRALYVLMGGDPVAMRHWMDTPNRHLNGSPHELIGSVQGLVDVGEYLDAIRGKV